MAFQVEFEERDIGHLQAAVENLRSADKTDARVEAAWRVAFELEALAIRADAARRAQL